jgi:hypothetical protein
MSFKHTITSTQQHTCTCVGLGGVAGLVTWAAVQLLSACQYGMGYRMLGVLLAGWRHWQTTPAGHDTLQVATNGSTLA